jgi:hypothetical protein
MTDGMHLGDEVEIVTDRLAGEGAPRGSVGIIVDDWADGSNDVEVSDPDTGVVLARVRAAENEIRKSTRTVELSEPRKHGIIFGRGDDLGAPAGDPPSRTGNPLAGMPYGGTNGPWYGDETPPAEGEIVGEIPWELRDAPQTGPLIL